MLRPDPAVDGVVVHTGSSIPALDVRPPCEDTWDPVAHLHRSCNRKPVDWLGEMQAPSHLAEPGQSRVQRWWSRVGGAGDEPPLCRRPPPVFDPYAGWSSSGFTVVPTAPLLWIEEKEGRMSSMDATDAASKGSTVKHAILPLTIYALKFLLFVLLLVACVLSITPPSCEKHTDPNSKETTCSVSTDNRHGQARTWDVCACCHQRATVDVFRPPRGRWRPRSVLDGRNCPSPRTFWADRCAVSAA